MVMDSLKEFKFPGKDAERFDSIGEKLAQMDWDVTVHCRAMHWLRGCGPS